MARTSSSPATISRSPELIVHNLIFWKLRFPLSDDNGKRGFQCQHPINPRSPYGAPCASLGRITERILRDEKTDEDPPSGMSHAETERKPRRSIIWPTPSSMMISNGLGISDPPSRQTNE